MVDIHSHILPGIDDGARDMEETVAMLRMAHETGTTDIVATPHADTQFQYDPGRVQDLLNAARERAPSGLRLHRGCDFHLTLNNVHDALAHPTRYTINGGRYLMVELSDLVIFSNTGDLYRQLEDAGMRIVLTHPERNPLLRQRLELIEEWVSAGRYMQVTASSLLGQWGPKALAFSRTLLDKSLVHFIASDGHSLKSRPPRLDSAREWVAQNYSGTLARALFEEHPRAVIEDGEIPLTVPPAGRPSGKSVANKGGFLSRLLGRNRQVPLGSEEDPTI